MNNLSVTRHEIEGVFSTKKGLHEFLTIECNYFLPPNEYTNIEWLRDISQGKKRVLRNIDAIQAQCPHIEGARVDDILKFIKRIGKEDYLPGRTRTGKDPLYNRPWLLSLAMSMNTEEFLKFREEAMTKRKQKFLTRTN